MKLLHVTPCYAPAWAYGDVPGAVTALARAQAARGHEVVVLTTDAVAPHERLPAGETRDHGVRIVRMRNSSSMARTWLHLSTPVALRARTRALLAEGFDLVHAHELRAVETRAIAAAVPRDVPLAISPHGRIGSVAGRSLAERVWDRLAGDRVLERADLIVAATSEEADAARALWSARHRMLGDHQVAVVPHGVDLSGVSQLPDRRGARERFALGHDGPVALSPGPVSGDMMRLLVQGFAAAAERTPNAQLLIAGTDRRAGEHARALIDALRVKDRVRIAGYLAEDGWRAALAAADVMVVASDQAPSSRRVLEAMASGRPLVVAARGGADEAWLRGAGYVVPPTIDGWCAALDRLFASADARATMGATARGVAGAATWAAVAQRLEAEYRVLRERPTR